MGFIKCIMIILQRASSTPGMLLIGHSLPVTALIGASLRASTPILSSAFNGITFSKSMNVCTVHELFASIEFESTACRIGLYSEDQSIEDSTLSNLRRAETVKANHLLMELWPSIGDDEFVVGNVSVNKVRDLRIKLAHRRIATTISSRRDSTQRITEIDIFYIYCIYTQGVVCNIPYWEMVDRLNMEPPTRVFKKKSLIMMGVIMELHEGACYWPKTQKAEKDDEAKEATEEEAGEPLCAYKDVIFDEKKPGSS
uniref:Uncharacterized protein n=1 Tax=Tanacetum cinerariifolium TaxID=118510 RepID=A0A6L2K0H5_TANCI|nr:hypothetical protein [Tanacetum cinerariifolium]